MNPADYEALLADPEPFVTHDDAAIRRLAVAAMRTAGMTPENDRVLTAVLTEDGDPRVRAEAAEALGSRPSAGGALLLATEDPDAVVREAAVTALGEHAYPAAIVRLSTLVSADPDRLVREAAVAALGSIGDPAALPVLLEAVEHGAPQVRRRAVVALTVFEGTEVEEALRRAAHDRNPMVREVAEMVVGRPHTWEPLELESPSSDESPEAG